MKNPDGGPSVLAAKRLLKLLAVLIVLIYEDLLILVFPALALTDFRYLAVILLADLFVGWDIFIRPMAERGRKDEYPTWKIILFFVVSPLYLGAPYLERMLLSARYQPALLLDVLVWIGLFLVLCGGVLLIWSRTTLGAFGSPKVFLREDHRLIRSGPYRVLRNPMYTADLLLYFGIACAFGGWISAAFAVATLTPILLERTKLEERLLRERFGEEYDRWAKTTWRLIPFLW